MLLFFHDNSCPPDEDERAVNWDSEPLPLAGALTTLVMRFPAES